MDLKLYPRYIKKDDVVIEVGAFRGGSTVLLSSLASWVYTFEPDRRFFRTIKKVAKAHGNVEAYNVAVGSEKGTTYLNQIKNWYAGVSSIPKIAELEYTKKQKTNVIALDDFDFRHRPTALVIDCEGFEHEVLKGARKLLESVKTVLVETHYLQDGHATLEECRRDLELAGKFDISVETDRDGMPWLLCSARAPGKSLDTITDREGELRTI